MHPFAQYIVETIRRRHPERTNWRVEELLRPYRCRYGNEVVLDKVPGGRAETCQHCGCSMEPDTPCMSIYRQRYSEGWQAGRYHLECWDDAVKSAPERRGFCWLTGNSGWINGKAGKVRVMSLQNTLHKFTATESELLRIKRRYVQCKSKEGVAKVLHNYRQRLVSQTLWHYFTKACRAIDREGGDRKKKQKELQLWEAVTTLRASQVGI